MGKQVPLVMYRRGVRIVLGMASVENDGSISSKVADDMWPQVRDLFLPNVGEFSIIPVPKKPVTEYDKPAVRGRARPR